MITNPADGKTKKFNFDTSYWSFDGSEEREDGYTIPNSPSSKYGTFLPAPFLFFFKCCVASPCSTMRCDGRARGVAASTSRCFPDKIHVEHIPSHRPSCPVCNAAFATRDPDRIVLTITNLAGMPVSSRSSRMSERACSRTPTPDSTRLSLLMVCGHSPLPGPLPACSVLRLPAVLTPPALFLDSTRRAAGITPPGCSATPAVADMPTHPFCF